VSERLLLPGIGLVAAIVAVVSLIAPWGEDDRGTYHGAQEVGGTMFGALIGVAALIGALIALRGITEGDDVVSGGRLRRSHLLMAAGGAVLGPALAFALSPEVTYTSWKASGLGGWLAAAMGLVMLLSGYGWARRQPMAPTAGISSEIDRSFGIGLLAAGVLAVLVPFFGWLKLAVDDDTDFIYGALQDGLRGVGLVVFPAAVLMLVAGALIVYRYNRPSPSTTGGIGAEHLGLVASATGLSTALAFLLSIIRNDLDEAVDPVVGLYLYLVAALIGLYVTASALLFPGQLSHDEAAEGDPEEAPQPVDA